MKGALEAALLQLLGAAIRAGSPLRRPVAHGALLEQVAAGESDEAASIEGRPATQSRHRPGTRAPVKHRLRHDVTRQTDALQKLEVDRASVDLDVVAALAAGTRRGQMVTAGIA